MMRLNNVYGRVVGMLREDEKEKEKLHGGHYEFQ